MLPLTGDERRAFFHSLRTLALPMVLQNLISSAVNSADVLMLGYVGESALSAVSLANQLLFWLYGLFFGISSAIGMLVSQYWGKGDRRSIQAVMGIALKITLVVTSMVSAAAIFLPEPILRIFTPNQELITIGSSYLRVIGVAWLFQGMSQVYEATMRSMGRAALSTRLVCIALVLNITLNAVFLFGLLGAPRLGVVGVGVATLIARGVELLLCLMDAHRSQTLDYDVHILLGAHPGLRRDFIRYAVPALLNDFVWTAAFSSYSIIYGHLGADMVAASAVATTVQQLTSTVAFGMSGAGTVLVGRELGAGRTETARAYASTLCRLTLCAGVVTGAVILTLRPLVLQLYGPRLSATGWDYLSFMLLVSSYYVIGQQMNTLVIAGIFRAGGDARFGLLCDFVTMWVVSVPVSFFSAFVLHLPVKAVYFIICLDEFYKIPTAYRHYKRYRWLKDITREYE